jgi:predicted ATPase
VDFEGDAFFYAFDTAEAALAAVSEAMDGLDGGPIKIRVGIHTGEPQLDPPKYVGMDVHRAARIMAAAHGGQVVLSRATRVLVDNRAVMELGEHRLKDFAEPVAIYQLGRERFPPLKTISNTNLPGPASSFVGREAELAEVVSRLEAGARLLTLTGPGGTGKTRLALEAASTLVPDYKAGVFWVGLSTLREPGLVSETIAQTLGAKDGLADHIAERELLLLLDNLEQVIEVAPELAALLATCPNLTLLVTSRELLRVQGEVEYRVPPLAEPEAVSLFCQRAQLEPTEDIAELCARLDNLPLAIELAAARTTALAVPQILQRLTSHLDLLRGGRDSDPRQQTLRATIEWSHDLLSESEQRLFARLAVFNGGCTLEAAEAVCEADLDTLQSLVEKSLLRFSNGRYWMLQTIEDYAAQRLEPRPDAATTGARHTDFIVALAEQAHPWLRGSDPIPWLDVLEREHDNIRATLGRLREQGASELELRLAVAVGDFWCIRGPLAEGRLNLAHALAAAGDSPLRAKALHEAGFIALKQGSRAEAEALLEQGWLLARQSDDLELTAHLLWTLAGTVSDLDEAKARTLYGELLAFVEEHGEERFPIAFVNLGDFALRQGDFASAEHYSRKSLLYEKHQLYGRALALGNLALALLGLGRDTEATETLLESLRIHERLGDHHETAISLSTLASVVAERGELGRAARLLAYAERRLREIEADVPRGFEGELHQRALARVREELPDFDTVWAAGEAMTQHEAITLALGEQAERSPPADEPFGVATEIRPQTRPP